MSYQVLARKWRPRRFQDMIGQEHVLRILTNGLDQKRLHHAYLFTGTRGVGKTTLGRILAKCFNCETDITSTPCGICSTCKAIDAGQFLDLYEVDAASRTKVEDTRELLDNVLYMPTQGRYKIYLIDETHMLSNHSFNALLKTLEEPPEHVKFVLATTDPKRLPTTILSRCLQFHLKKITSEQITKHLQYICTEEAVANELPALEQLAKAADGSMRDALSLLDQTIAYGQGSVNKKDVSAILGSMAQEDILPLLQALAAQNGLDLLNTITLLAERAPDFQQILEELISLFHQIAIHQLIPNAVPLDESIAIIAQQFTPEDIQLYYQIALLGKRDLAFTPTPQQGFEMTMLRMLAFKPTIHNMTINTPITPLAIEPPAPTTSKPIMPLEEKATAAFSSMPAMEWRDLLPKLELSGMAYALAANCTFETITENKIVLTLSAKHQPMLNQKLQERLSEAFLRYFKRPMQLEIMITTADLSTPIKQQQHEQKQHLEVATHTIMQDPRVKQLIDMYDATVEVSLLA